MSEKELLELVNTGVRVFSKPEDAEYLGDCTSTNCAYNYYVYRLKNENIVYMQYRI